MTTRVLRLDFTDKPIPAHYSDLAKMSIRVHRLAPLPYWVNYGAIGDVLGVSGYRVACALLPTTTTEAAGQVSPSYGPWPTTQTWDLDWSRLRNKDGSFHVVGGEESDDDVHRFAVENWLAAQQGVPMLDAHYADPAFRIPVDMLQALAQKAGVVA